MDLHELKNKRLSDTEMILFNLIYDIKGDLTESGDVLKFRKNNTLLFYYNINTHCLVYSYFNIAVLLHTAIRNRFVMNQFVLNMVSKYLGLNIYVVYYGSF